MIEEKKKEIQDYYTQRATTNFYATSPDMNLREIEIEYLGRYLKDNIKILDVGCGNGYSTLTLASKYASSFTGIDFTREMIIQAKDIQHKFTVKKSVKFYTGDVTQMQFNNEEFDIVISERCLLNLPTKDEQWQAIREIARVLKPDGKYLMLEGTIQGLQQLNILRSTFNLDPIPDADPRYNWFSNKFDEAEMIPIVMKSFPELEHIQRFGMYYFISRVIHPLLMAPEQPKYNAKINEIAKLIATHIPNFEDIGHVALFIFRK